MLAIKIRALFEANNEEYGYRRIHAALVRGGEAVDDETVRKIMRDLGLAPCQPKPHGRSKIIWRVRSRFVAGRCDLAVSGVACREM